MRHLDATARRYFQEEAWNESPKVGMWTGMFVIFVIVLVFHFLVLPADYWDYGAGFSGGLTSGFSWIYIEYEKEMNNLFSAIVAAIRTPAHVRRQMRKLHARDPHVVVPVCTLAVLEYRQQVASQRERALGIDSKWTGKREAIAGAEDGAARALAYWTERLRQEPGIPGARERVEAASAHSRKLRSALESLDRHIDAVRTGFLECGKRIDAMERRIDDVAQIRRLGALPHTSGGGQALADESVKAITGELLGEAEELGAAMADLSRLASAGASRVAGEDVERLAEEVVTESEEADRAIEGLGATGTDEPQNRTPPQEPKSPDMRAEPEPGAVEPPETPPKRQGQSSPKPWPDPAKRIAELKRKRIAREADSEQRMQEIGAQSEQRERDFEERKREIQARSKQREREVQAEFEQRQQEIQAGFEGLQQQVRSETLRRRQEILTESLRRQQEIRARLEPDPPATTPDPGSEPFDTLDTTPENHPQSPPAPPSRSTSSQTPATIGETQEEKQMKELVGMLRRMADLQDRRAHDLRFRDEFNWEADDREDLARKMTELADDIEMFQGLARRMKDMESGNPGT